MEPQEVHRNLRCVSYGRKYSFTVQISAYIRPSIEVWSYERYEDLYERQRYDANGKNWVQRLLVEAEIENDISESGRRKHKLTKRKTTGHRC